MVNAIRYSLMIFGKWIELIFNEFSFNYQSFNVSVGWVFIGCALIEIVINSVLNIPSRLPSRAFLFSNERLEVEKRQAIRSQDVQQWASKWRKNRGR